MLQIRSGLTDSSAWRWHRPSATQSNMASNILQNVKPVRKRTRHHHSARQIYWPLQLKQKPNRCLKPSEGAAWASVLIWLPSGKWRMFSLRQTAIAAVPTHVCGQEECLRNFVCGSTNGRPAHRGQWEWFIHSGKRMLSPVSWIRVIIAKVDG